MNLVRNFIMFMALIVAPVFATPITLVSVNGATQNNYYVGPLELKVGNLGLFQAVCVDFDHHVNVGQTWDGLVTSPLTGNYIIAAYLADVMMSGPSWNYGEMQFEIWSLFSNNSPRPIITQFTVPANYTAAGWSLVTPISPSDVQAFIVKIPGQPVPEPTTLLMTAIGLFALGFFLKRRVIN